MNEVAAALGTSQLYQNIPKVSVIMPCRNEFANILSSIESVMNFDYPEERLFLTVVDGMSDDGTRALLAALASQESRISLKDNPDRLPAAALNKALGLADGDIILRVDAHTIYPSDYARLCVSTLLETGADNVGGVCETIPGAETPIAAAIAYAMGHPFGVGNSRFRTGVQSRCWTDTVPFGCWRLETLQRLGGFATDLPYTEDDELNARIRRDGGQILLDPAIRSRYIARTTLTKIATMMYRYGRHKPIATHRIGWFGSWRQIVPPTFAAALIVSTPLSFVWPFGRLLIAAALSAHAMVGTLVAMKARFDISRSAALLLPVVFLTMHLAYGLGYLIGISALLLGRHPSTGPVQAAV